jgi:hypothetical protein
MRGGYNPPMRRPNLAPVAAVVAVLVLLLAGYMGAYYAMLEGRDYKVVTRHYVADSIPLYRDNGAIVNGLFWPARRIRPNHWSSYCGTDPPE